MPSPNPGVISTRGDANANRDASAQSMMQEQEPGSEFTVIIPDDLQQCFDRLEEIRAELGQLYSKKYGTYGTPLVDNFTEPPEKVRRGIDFECIKLETEESYLQARIYELQWALPPADYDGDAEEDEEEEGDMTQELETYAGPARDSATKVLGWNEFNGGNS